MLALLKGPRRERVGRCQRARRLTVVLLAGFGLLAPRGPAQESVKVAEAETSSPPLVVTELLAIGPMHLATRDPTPADPFIAFASAEFPKEGDVFQVPADSPNEPEAWSWTRVEADSDGVFTSEHLVDGYARALFSSDKGGPHIMVAEGHRWLSLNDESRAGDPHGIGTARFPVTLRAGNNDLRVRTGEGRLRIRFEPPPAPIYLEPSAWIAPDFVRGEHVPVHAAIGIANCTEETAKQLRVRCIVGTIEALEIALPEDDPRLSTSDGGTLPPFSVRRIPLELPRPPGLSEETVPVRLELRKSGQPETLHSWETTLRVVEPTQRHSRTFVSSIDGGVQSYAVLPPKPPDPLAAKPAIDPPLPALILTLHGASVRATTHVEMYAQRPWALMIAPDGRGPYGFDWEGWSRMDALEALSDAASWFDVDLDRQTVTGHSMGGHGAWHLAALHPDLFAATAPSSGWLEFWGTVGGSRTRELPPPLQERLQRAAHPSRMRLLQDNLASLGIYILHGEQDALVPVESVRELRSWLASFHADFAYREQPGASHWWGRRCVDWPPLIDFLRVHARQEAHSAHDISFVTVHPRTNAKHHWIVVQRQERWMQPSRVDATLEPDTGTIRLVTENISGLQLNLADLAGSAPGLVPGAPLQIDIGGRQLSTDWPAELQELWLERTEVGIWEVRREFDRALKGSHRAGPFLDAFRNDVLFVYGTRGTPAENDWAFRKARFDAECLHVQGQGAVEVVADVAFDAATTRDRNVVLYGNEETNLAWTRVLPDDCPFSVTRGVLDCPQRKVEGDVVALFVFPRRSDGEDSETATVGVIAPTGPGGGQVADHLPYFLSGVHLPDWIVLSQEQLSKGLEGVLGTGYFDTDWSMGGDSAWRDDP